MSGLMVAWHPPVCEPADGSSGIKAGAALSRRTPLSVTTSAWAAPVLVVGDFALLAVVPVVLVLIGTLRDSRVRSLRRPAGLLAAVYATPLALWLFSLAGTLALPTAMDPLSWHRHEMLFGFVGAVVAGFLLTAIPNWTGSLPVSGRALIGLFSVWAAGRVLSRKMSCRGRLAE